MLQTGETFERKYIIRELLGSGGFALVYRAEQPDVGRDVAIKILRSAEEIGTHPATLLKRFQREAQMAAELRHPANIQLFDFGTAHPGQLYMIFEHIDGIPLDDLIRATGPMSVARVVHILTQLLEALSEAHQLGILHRDVKPANVIIYERLGKKDLAKLIDYGIAKPMGKQQGKNITAEGHVVGTPRYMAPEQILMMGELSPATDIYSLGLVAYEMLAGQSLLGDSTHTEVIKRQLSGEVFRVPPTVPAPPGLRSVVDKMLAKSARDRFQSAEDAIAALRRVDVNEEYEVVPPVQQMLQTLGDTVSSSEFVGQRHDSYEAPTRDSRPLIPPPDPETLEPNDPTLASGSHSLAGTPEPPTMERSAQALAAAAADRPRKRRRWVIAGAAAALAIGGGLGMLALNPDVAKGFAYDMRDGLSAATSACDDDEHEPNNRSATGTELGATPRTGVLCPGDVDWYVLGFYNEGDTVKVGIKHEPGDYDIDMELYIGPKFEAGVWSPKMVETIERKISAAGMVAVRVYYPSVEGEKGRGYTITRDVDSIRPAEPDRAEAGTGRILHVTIDDVKQFRYWADGALQSVSSSEDVPQNARSAVLVEWDAESPREGHVLFTDLTQVGEGDRLTIEEISQPEWDARRE